MSDIVSLTLNPFLASLVSYVRRIKTRKKRITSYVNPPFLGVIMLSFGDLYSRVKMVPLRR